MASRKITKKERPVAEFNSLQKPKRALSFGAMKDTVLHFEGPFSPAYDGPWDAKKGVWEPED